MVDRIGRTTHVLARVKPPASVASRWRADAVLLSFRSHCSFCFCSIFNFCSELWASIRKYALDDALEGLKPWIKRGLKPVYLRWIWCSALSIREKNASYMWIVAFSLLRNKEKEKKERIKMCGSCFDMSAALISEFIDVIPDLKTVFARLLSHPYTCGPRNSINKFYEGEESTTYSFGINFAGKWKNVARSTSIVHHVF